MIQLKNITKKYKGRKLFSRVNIKINKPGIYSFIGENGCGKTTLLNIIARFIKPSKGTVNVNSKDISFVSQNVNLLSTLTIREHFEMFSLDNNLLKKVNLISKVDKYPKELSFGMRQRIVVLMGLYSKSNIVVLDEPTSHLDKYNTNILMREIKKISENKIVLLVSHDKKIVDRVSDEIYFINNKKITLIRENNSKRKFLNTSKNKVTFHKYIRRSFKLNKKINIYYFLVILFLSISLNFTINLKENFLNIVKNNEINSLEYNKFYLKECKSQITSSIKIKKCTNLSDKNVKILSNSNNLLSLNYDVLINDLYGKNNLSVINRNVNLKEGRYPKLFNEVITTDRYSLNEQIVLEANKVISHKKTDIYKDKIKLKVVGIVNSVDLSLDDKLYFYYDYVTQYFNNKKLINNNISLYEYFKDIDINNYKYVIYFNRIDLSLLENLNIDYLSASYQYIQSLNKTFKEIINQMNYFNIFIIAFSFIYIIRIIRKKVKSKYSDIMFLKACGVSKKKLGNVIGLENDLLSVVAVFASELILILLLNLFFKKIIVDYFMCILLLSIILLFNKKFLNKEIKRQVSI